jgi:hypothetical protein
VWARRGLQRFMVLLDRVVDAQGGDCGHHVRWQRSLDALDRQESNRCRRRNPNWKALPNP